MTLVFFIHGVATKDAGYSRKLESLIKGELIKQNQLLPHFYASFWGNVLKQTGQIWNWIHQDLQDFKKSHPKVDAKDIFRYQEFRQDFISEFFGDILTYFNTERGRKIRELIAQGLSDFIKNFPTDEELHIVTHSLGSVVLWDVLFSEKFEPDDPAYEIRAMIGTNRQETYLKSITTMGSPILFFNMMLNVNSIKVKDFTEKYQTQPFRWLNIIHSSDIIAYPLKASLNAVSIPTIFFRDEYIWADANAAERGALPFGQAHAAMGIGVSDGHCYYWNSRGTARLVAANILGDCTAIDSALIDNN